MLTIEADSNFPESAITNEKHCSKILYLLNEHRKENTKLCDVTLQVNGKEFPVHKSVLAACSPYFLAMFNGDMKESSEKCIELKDIKEEFLEMLIEFAYTGEIDVTIENVEGILELASELQFPEVSTISCNFLKTQLDSTNCIGIRRFVKLCNCKSFVSFIDTYILKHYNDIVASDEFVQIPLEGLKKAISSPLLNVKNEMQVYNSVMKWVKNDLEEREENLPKLLSMVSLPLVSKDFLLQTIDKEATIKNSFKCRDILDDAKNYHLQPEKHSELRSFRTIPRVSTAGKLFAIGGRDTDDTFTEEVEAFCAYENEWTPYASLPHPRIQLGTAELKRKLYACGGGDGTKRLDTVEVYCPEKDTWEKGKSMQLARSGLVANSLGDAVYVLGGFDGRVCLDSVERYDPDKDKWEYVASLNTVRSFPGVTSLNNNIYLVGGNDGISFLDTCEVYDAMLNKWSFTTPLTGIRAGLGCATLDGRIYVAGGYDGTNVLNKVEMLDPRMNKWQEVASMVYARDGCCLTSYSGFLVAVGGACGFEYLDKAEYYDPLTNQWLQLKPMKIARAVTSICVLPNEETFI